MPAFFAEFAESEVHSLEEMIEWNKKHAETCLQQGKHIARHVVRSIS